MTIAKRLILLLGVPLVVLIGLGIYTHRQLDRIEERSRFVAESRIDALATIANLSRQFEELRVEAREYLLSDDEERAQIRARFDEGERELSALLRLYADSLVVSDQGRRLLGEFQTQSAEWLIDAKRVMSLVDEGRGEEALALAGGQMELGMRLSAASGEWILNNEELAERAGQDVTRAIETFRTRMMLVTAAAVLLAGILGYLTVRRIVVPIRGLRSSVETIASGDYRTEVPFMHATDEAGALARSIDVLKRGAEEMDDQRWVKSQVSAITGDLQGATSFADFGERLLSGLVPLIGGGVASFYVFDESTHRLRKSATYGLPADAAADEVGLGEGLIGQCARDRRPVTLSGLPPDYLLIGSSVGTATPTFAKAWPVLLQDSLLGVCELASFQAFGSRSEALLEQLLPVTAMSLEVLQRNLRLEDTERFFRSVLELAPDGLMVVDEQGVIQVANVQCEALFGYTQAELIGRSVETLVPEDVRAGHAALREAFNRNPSTRSMGAGRELQGQRKDGTLFAIEIGLSPLPGRNGSRAQTAVSIRDITERKQAEAELKRTNFLADSALDLTKSGYWHVPLDGSGWYNSSARSIAIFGDEPNPEMRYTLDHWSAHVFAGDEAAAKTTMENFAAAVAGTIPRYDSTYAYKRPVDGEVVWLHALGHVIKDEDGTPTDMYGVVQDVTDFKELERELLGARDTAEAATQMKSMFLANMSHEIRTPMNAVIGLSHLALKTQLSHKQRDYVTKIHSAGTSLLAIINDILDYSKIEAGKLEIEATTFRLDDVIASVTTLTGQKANERGLEFLARVSPGIPQVLIGDPIRLGQILTNLVNNAIKFTERGEVHVTAEVLEKTDQKCKLRFSVRDTGVGMTREQADRLFQPFMQADMSTTRRYGGTGLGLSISRRLVELMEGEIWLESELGAGSTFTFTVWLGVAEDKASRKVVPEKLASLRALIVDDNAAAREILEDMLEGVVKQADVVASGAEAIAALRDNAADDPYDVVFMDWRMPGMDGLEAVRIIKQEPRIEPKPAIVMVTAFGREDVREEAERLELDGFLLKPLTKSMIVDALVSVFADSAEQAAAVDMANEQGIDLSGMRVLVVEDNEINQQIAVELIEGVGASVTVADNGKLALDILMEGPTPTPFEAVLMDLQMPVMDGFQATEAIRADPRFASLPIVALTAHATMEERQRCIAAGMNDHVAKPIDPGLLYETLGRFHHGTTPVARPEVSARAHDGVPNVEGLDTAAGLSRVAGNERLYLKLLRQFVDQQAEAVTEIRALLQERRTEDAERLAHTLKGVSATLGVKDVPEVAETAERAIKDRAPSGEIDVALEKVEAALGLAVTRLRDALAVFAPDAVTTSAAVDPAQTRAAVAELTSLLADFDAGAIEFVEGHAAVLRPLFAADAWSQFLKQVQAFAFPDALAMLEATDRGQGSTKA
ncbi:MAG TPA: response regulator [Gemmatimonadota bacterium]|nr:response regulator [Gemmatimonadota bacterium]